MNDSIILHHYDASPYAEKVRLMLGLTNTHWYSLLSPVQPPRPNLDPLTGGYRRIPVAQIGSDIFCDTTLIAKELAKATKCPALDPTKVDKAAAALMSQAEQEVFFATIGAVKPIRLIGTLIRQFGPIGSFRFLKDRSGLMTGGTARPAQGERAKALVHAFLETLEIRLAEHDWVNGDEASVADFAIYHPLWLYVLCKRSPLKAGPNVEAWYQRVGEIGHGRREDITQAQAFAAARNTSPRPLPASVEDIPVAIGQVVEVGPSDYGIKSVTGTLVAVTEDRIILEREDADLGKLHVHFPREGYLLASK